MKVRTNKLFPYPVLSVFSDSYKDNVFLCDTTFEYDSVTAYFKLHYNLNDEGMKKLLIEGKVGLFFIVDCSETKYRELFKVTLDENNDFSKDIPLERLNGDFEIVSLVITNEEIKDYQNPNLSEIYDGEIVFLPKYAIVGFTDTEVFFVNKKIDSNGDIPSIFTITFEEEGKNMSFDPDGDVVIIYLPKNEYDIYNEYKGKHKRLKQLMINFPVLVNLLDILKEEDSYSSKPWYNALESIIVNKGYPDGIKSDTFKNTLSTKIAQDLLGNLIQDAFAEFDELNVQE